jgi:hypothetical protein
MEPHILDADLPVTGNPRIDHWLALAGALVPMCSMLAGKLNQQIRDAQAAGEEVSEGLLRAAQIVNLIAVNLDKSKQIAKMVADMRAAKKVLGAAGSMPPAHPAPESPSHIPAGPAPVDPPKQP